MNQELISKVNQRIEAAYQSAESKFNRTFERPNVEYKKIGTKGGLACHSENKIILNEVLLQENESVFIARTVPHECAHLIARKVYTGIKSHGPEWRNVCRIIGMTDVTRCHSYDVKNARVRASTKTETIFCDCNTYKVTPKVYNRIKDGLWKYQCKKCKGNCGAI